MAVYGSLKLTTAGLALYTKAQSGITLTLTRMRIGSGQSAADPSGFTNLITPVAYFPINSITVNGNTANIKGIFDNSALGASTYTCEIGIFAQDPDVGEILYAYANAGAQGDTVPAFSAGPISKQFQISVAVGTATSVTANVPGVVYIATTEKGAASGVATLDSTTHIPIAQIPNVTGDPAIATAYGLTGTITQLFSWLFKYIKSITGNVNTFDAPVATIVSLKNVSDGALPKAGGTMTGGITMANATGITAVGGGSMVSGAAGASWIAKAGSATANAFTAQDNAGTNLLVIGTASSPSVTTKNNTLDDGLGKMSLASDLTTKTVNVSSQTGAPSSWSNALYFYYRTAANSGQSAFLQSDPTGALKYNGTSTIWHAGNDGAGSGLDADILDGRQGNGYALTSDKFTKAQLQNTQLQSGIFTNDGQGLFKADGVTTFVTGWYHIYHSYHGVDGYAVQVAYPYALGSTPDQTVYWRNSQAFTWGEWQAMGATRSMIASSTVQHTLVTTDTSYIPGSSYAGILVAKFMPLGVGEVVISFDLMGHIPSTTGGSYTVLGVFSPPIQGTSSANENLVTATGPNWQTPIGTNLGVLSANSGPVPFLTLGYNSNSLDVWQSFSVTLQIRQKVPIYLIASTSLANANAEVHVRNLSVKYDTI